MSDQEKRDRKNSALLAKAMGKYKVISVLAVVDALADNDRKHYWQNDGVIEQIPNLYDPANMTLAWRVHLWALNDDKIKGRYYRWCRGLDERPWWIEVDPQRLWLDRIAELVRRRQYLEEASEEEK